MLCETCEHYSWHCTYKGSYRQPPEYDYECDSVLVRYMIGEDETECVGYEEGVPRTDDNYEDDNYEFGREL